jgi:pyruvate/2-oxoglutarate dehydrogenase complex dihydrolipoamide dehydrogenase (E3) component
LIEREKPNAVIVATGAKPRRPHFDGEEDMHVVDVWQVLRGEANVGSSVVVADFRCDWVGMGIAEKLARDGCRVRLAVNGYMPGQRIQQYVRDSWSAVLHKLGIEIIPQARLFGADAETVYLQHTGSGEAIVCDGVNTLVLAQGHEPVAVLEAELDDYPGETHFVGDCLAPRTAEEAVLEGLRVAAEI